ncbi:MAG: IS66 family insertion sequence element accessory protein TnpB [Betaproteobacteria bacterium]
MLRPSTWWLAVEPIDLRCGIDRLLVVVQSIFGRDAFDGSAYVFRNRSGSRIKLVLGDATGVWLCVRRLQQGGFVWPRAGDALCRIDAQQFEWLCKGVDWQRLSMRTESLVRAL